MSNLHVSVLSVSDRADKRRAHMFAFLAAVGTFRRGSYSEGLILLAGHTVRIMVEVSICKNKKFFHSDTSGHKVSCSQHLIARACAHTLSTRASTSTRVLQAMSFLPLTLLHIIT